MKKFIFFIILLLLFDSCSSVLDYPLRCSWWTWNEWNRRDCLPLGHPTCAKAKRREFRYRFIQWRPKYGQKLCSGKYIDYRPCICLSPEAVIFVTPPKAVTDWAMIKELITTYLTKPIYKMVFAE